MSDSSCRGKRSFASGVRAQTVADFESANKELKGTDQLYAYLCPECSYYHLTKNLNPRIET